MSSIIGDGGDRPTPGVALNDLPGAPVLVKGYRKLSDDEIGLINQIKNAEVLVMTMCQILENTPEVDKRWKAIGKTDLEKGFMALVRSVARPE